jgi:hypothetical protein
MGIHVNDEMKTRTHDSWNVKLMEVYNKRKGKEWLRDSAAGHVLMDMTLHVTVTKGAEVDGGAMV